MRLTIHWLDCIALIFSGVNKAIQSIFGALLMNGG